MFHYNPSSVYREQSPKRKVTLPKINKPKTSQSSQSNQSKQESIISSQSSDVQQSEQILFQQQPPFSNEQSQNYIQSQTRQRNRKSLQGRIK